MPSVPVIIPRIPLEAPLSPKADYSNLQRGFGAIGEFGQVLQHLQDGSDKAEAIKNLAVGKAQLSADLQELSDTISDPNEFLTQAKDRQQRLLDNISGSFSNDRSRKLFNDSFADETITHTARVNHAYRLKQASKAKADTDTGLATLLDAAKNLGPSENLEGVNQMAKDMLANLVGNGLLQAPEAVNLFQKFESDRDEARAGAMLLKNPRFLKGIVESDEARKYFPELKPEQLYTLGQRATEVMREREAEFNKIVKERTEKVNQEILVAITAPNASLTLIRENIRQRIGKDLDAKDGEHWIDNIDRMIKERNKPAKEIDPFKTSNGATLAQVMAGVINEPDKWDSVKITSLMGNGLSVPHALQAIALLEKANRDPAGTLTPLKQAQASWNRVREMLSFVPERLRNDPETAITNDREAQRIWDQVSARADKGEDPRVALEELMVPFYEEKTKSFFDREQWFPSHTREERIKARQALIRSGVTNPTADEIKGMAERLRRVESPYATQANTPAARPVQVLRGIEIIPPGESVTTKKEGYDNVSTVVGPIRVQKDITGPARQKVIDDYVRAYRSGPVNAGEY